MPPFFRDPNQAPPSSSQPPQVYPNPFTLAYCREHKWFPVFLVIYLGIALALSIYSLDQVIQKDPPLLSASTPCPVLTGSMVPTTYQMENSATGPVSGWNFISRVKPSSSTTSPLEILLKNRCFNGQSGSSVLLVNNQLAAFTRTEDTDIFDCHGKRIWKVEEASQLKVFTDSGTHILTSAIPYHGGNMTVFGQPSNQVVARIMLSTSSTLKSSTSQYDVTIENQMSPAADPGLLLMLCVSPQFLSNELV